MSVAAPLTTREASPWAAPPRGVSAPAGALRACLGCVATLLVVTAVAALAAVEVGPRLGLYRIETVLSGSMQPTFGPGDVIVVTPEKTSGVRVGQVISYQIPIGDHHVESHRVIRLGHERGRPTVITKGDANPAADPWRAKLTSDTAWRERLVIPKLGWLIIWLRQPLVGHLLVLVVPFLLAAWWLVGIWRPRPSPDQTAP